MFPFLVPDNLFSLRHLPVEMFAMVLRCLDPVTLVSCCLVNSEWANVCGGDRVLQESVRQQVKKHCREERRQLVDPKYGVTIKRQQPAKMFGKNVVKKVEKKNLPDHHLTQIFDHQPVP